MHRNRLILFIGCSFLTFYFHLDCIENDDDDDDSLGSDTLIDKSFAESTPKLGNETNFGCQRKKCCQLCESIQTEVTQKTFQGKIDEAKTAVFEIIDDNDILKVNKYIINRILDKYTDLLFSKPQATNMNSNDQPSSSK